MTTQFDEEQQETRPDDAGTQSDEYRTYRRCRSHQQHEQGCYQQEESCNNLAFQLRIAEYEALRQQCQQEATHHQSIEKRFERQREQHTNHRGHHQQIDEQHKAVNQEETVQRNHLHTFLRSTERKFHYLYQQQSHQRTTYSTPQHTIKAI